MRCLTIVITACLSLGCLTGCNIEDFDDVVEELLDAVGDIQIRQQELPPVLIQEGDTIVIDNSVTIIENPDTDIDFVNLPDLTILGFENITGWDIYIQYYVDDVFQAVYVYDGEVLLLEYPCIEIVELISEDDIDPFTGELVDTFDLAGFNYFNPEDFLCGDALILTFDPFSIEANVEVVDLVP